MEGRVMLSSASKGKTLNQQHIARMNEEEVALNVVEGAKEGDDTSRTGTERGQWGNRAEFFLSIMGYTVGIGSVWRFPILCSRNGGGAFLIPFFFFLLLAGWPLYYLEVCLGQFTGKSAGLAFEFCPLVKGTGALQVTISFITSWSSMLVLAWVYFYFYNSFLPVLPWSTCGNWWNTPACTALGGIFLNGTMPNATSGNASIITRNGSYASAAFEFWSRNTLRRSEGLEEMGTIQYHLVICLFLAWATVVLAVVKGAKSLGKVVYVTATLPYLLLTVMLIRAVTLEGATEGILYFVTPDVTKLASLQVWLEAALQVFISLGPSWGGVITMASYNKFHQHSFTETSLCIASSGFCSVYNGLVVFAILGFLAKVSGDTVQELAASSGAGIVFVAFPSALSLMPLPQLWSVLFFLALITVVFDSMFGSVEVVSCTLVDLFPRYLMKRREGITVILGLVMFTLGLPLTMNGGIYLLQLADWYFTIFGLFIGSCVEIIALCWLYGTDRFCRDISLMMGTQVPRVLRMLWTLPIPILAVSLVVIALVQYETPNYGDGYVYPDYAIGVGLGIGLIPVAMILIMGVPQVIKSKCNISKLLQPSKHWRPNDEEAKRKYRLHQYQYEKTLGRRILANLFGRRHSQLI